MVYNTYMTDYTRLNRAVLAIADPTAVLAGLATLEFRQSDIAAVRGLQDGYNDVAPDYSSYTELDYSYGVAIKQVEAGGRNEDDVLTRYANAVANVRGDTTKLLGLHFDEQQLAWANAVANLFLANTYRAEQQLWEPTNLPSVAAWYDATKTENLSFVSGRLRWADASGNANTANDTIGTASLSESNWVGFTNSRMFLTSPLAIRAAFFVMKDAKADSTQSVTPYISAVFGQNTTSSSGAFTFLRVNTEDYDISIDGGNDNLAQGTVRINGNQGSGGNITVPNIDSNVATRPPEIVTIQFDLPQATDFFAWMRGGANAFYGVNKTGQMMFFTSPLTTADVLRLEAYYSHLYAIALNPSHPLAGKRPVLPTLIQAEDYVAASDADPANQGGAYRDDDGVDIESDGTTTNVGWFQAGEWLEYEIDVVQAGEYSVSARLSADSFYSGVSRTLRFTANGSTSDVTSSEANGWTNYSYYDGSGLLTLVEGVNTIRATLIDASWNFDNFVLTQFLG